MTEPKRVRSPNYPAISLLEAIEAANKLHGKIGRHPAAREAIAKTLGYGSLNGASMTAISALSKYGILEKSGEDLKLSERAMRLIAAQSVEEHTEALWEAARAPVLFAELVEQYKGKLPDDEVIRSYLKRKGFADSALPQVIQSFRETMEFVTREAGEYDEQRRSEAQEVDTGQRQPERERKIPPPVQLSLGEQEFFRSRLSPQSTVRVLVSGPAGPKEIDKLIRLLQLQKEVMQEDDGTNST